jgi:hypothetical protein
MVCFLKRIRLLLLVPLTLLGCCALVVFAFVPLFPCGERPLTTEEIEAAKSMYSPLEPEYLRSWYVPCGATDLGLEDRVRVARIVRLRGSDMRMIPLVLRIEFQGIYTSPRGGKAYEFAGRTFFGKTITIMRATESCGSIIGAGQSFGEGICP